MRMGVACGDITPGPEHSLIGYDFRQQHLPSGNLGVLDPLYCRSLALETDAGLLIWVSLDLCILSVPSCRQLRQQIADRCEVPVAQVMISCSHTHSGPWVRDEAMTKALEELQPATSASMADAAAGEGGRAYGTQMAETVLATVQQSVGLTVPVSMHVSEAPLGIGYCRRVPTADGVQLCWNPQEQDHLQPGPNPDPTVTVITFQQIGGPRRHVLFSIGAHPTVLGKTSRHVSADWPGQAVQHLQSTDGYTTSQFVLGACGEVHPWIATQGEAEGARIVGQTAGQFVKLLSHASGPDISKDTISIKDWSGEIAGTDCDLITWRFGPLTVAASPTELFASLGSQLRERIGGPVLQATNTNGWTGYWPAAADFPIGDYEVNAAKAHGRDSGCGEALIERLASLAASSET